MTLAQHGTTAFPETPTHQTETSLNDCDVAVADLAEQAKPWLDERPCEVRAMLERLNDAIMANAQAWVSAACAAKHIDPDSALAGEEWASITVTARYVRLLTAALADITDERKPQFPGRPHPVTGGHTAIPAFPFDAFDKVTFQGFSAEIWLRRGVAGAQAVDGQARTWFGGGDAGVSLVLGAGNVASIAATDTLDRLCVLRHPVILKMNPVNDYLGPIFETVFAEFVARGILRIVYGGAEVGTHLVRHDGVSDVHVTGSDKTFEAIVFGTGDEGDRRRAANDPLVTKPVTGELGNVSPVIVVPGRWSAKDLDFQAQNIASMIANNAGFNCIAMRTLIMPTDWDQRDALLDAIRDVLRAIPERFPYYPGARDRYDRFVGAHPEAERYGDDGPDCVPWTLIPGLRPGVEDEIAFTTEAFNGVFGEVGIEARGPVDYLRKAVEFANDEMWGTLGCSLIVAPQSLKDPEVNRAVEQAIADLRYGTVGVNHWSGLGFLLGSTTWGAYPAHTADDVQSGIGIVHNSMMLDEADVEKTVLRGPFRMPLKPSWFVTNKTARQSGEAFARLMAKPTWGRLPGLITSSIRG